MRPFFHESHHEAARELHDHQDSADEVPRDVPHGVSTEVPAALCVPCNFGLGDISFLIVNIVRAS